MEDKGGGVLAKTEQLRMVAVSGGRPCQDGLSEERFPPQGDEPACVEVPRMETPQAHVISITSDPSRSKMGQEPSYRDAGQRQVNETRYPYVHMVRNGGFVVA